MENPLNNHAVPPYFSSVEFVSDPILEALAAAVSGELTALNHLRFKFEVQQMVLFGNRGVWIEETTSDLELAIADVQDADVVFRRCLADAARHLGMSPESTLREIVGSVGEPWAYIFSQGREDLTQAIERVGHLCTENRKLLAQGYLATTQALSMLGVDTPLGYDASGAPSAPPSSIILNTKA